MVLNLFRRPAARPPRYYVYISQAKLDLLIPQVPTRRVPPGKAKIDAKIMNWSVAFEWSSDAAEPGLVSKVGILSDYLEKRRGWVGTVSAPGPYVKGVALLQYRLVPTDTVPLIVFGGVIDGVELALIGFEDFLVGAACDVASSHSIDNLIERCIDGQYPAPRGTDTRDAGAAVSEYTANPAMRESASRPACFALEFLAMPLYRRSRMLVATPIYLALDHRSGRGGRSV